MIEENKMSLASVSVQDLTKHCDYFKPPMSNLSCYMGTPFVNILYARTSNRGSFSCYSFYSINLLLLQQK